MKSELDVLNQLQSFLEKNLDVPVLLDYPMPDNMPQSTVVYIEPEEAEYEALTMYSDVAVLHSTIYILAKKDKSEELLKRVFKYSEQIFTLIRENQTLDGFLDFAVVNTLTYYPEVEVNKSIKAIEISLDLQWTKDWL